MDKRLIGVLGEKLVCKWYTDHKYKLLSVNYKTRQGEIDIIAEDEIDKKIEFIEVKRQAKNFDEQILKKKAELFFKAVGSFNGFAITYRGLSMQDM